MTIPEISGGPFFEAIVNTIAEYKPDVIIEVGSSNGLGSTMALVIGRDKVGTGEIHCIEIDKGRCDGFKENHRNREFVHLHEGCSVSLIDYMSEKMARTLWDNNPQFNCHAEHIDKILGWRKSEMNDISLKSTPMNKLDECIDCHFIPNTFVLLDGSAFTGEAELIKVLGAKVIALDDTVDIKHFNSCKQLNSNAYYKIKAKNDNDRNGWAIYVRS